MSHLKKKPPCEQKLAQQFLDGELSERERALLSKHLPKTLLVQPLSSCENGSLKPIIKKLVSVMELDDGRYKWITFGKVGADTAKFRAIESWLEYQLENVLQPAFLASRSSPASGSGTESDKESVKSQLCAPQNLEDEGFNSPEPKLVTEQTKAPETMEKL